MVFISEKGYKQVFSKRLSKPTRLEFQNKYLIVIELMTKEVVEQVPLNTVIRVF
jgi:hypothetical protein